ncbi:MAG: hypothetical protein WCO00_05195 [Rhodospirillaceae bacterium]
MLTLIIMMIIAIMLSLAGRRGQAVEYDADEIDFSGHKPDKKDLNRAREKVRHHKKIMLIAAAVIVPLAMMIDWRTGGNPFAGAGAQGRGQARSPGLVTFPGWQTGSVEIAPQGFSGRMMVRFESGEVSGGGFMIVAPGETRHFGWRVSGRDAPSCILRLDFKGGKSPETGWFGGFSFFKAPLTEGEHEATFHAWCPRGRNDADFQFATLTTSRDGRAVTQPVWKAATGADVRHR